MSRYPVITDWDEMTRALRANPTVEYRYMPGDTKVTHAIRPPAVGPALCGIEPWIRGDWMGTGSQEEYEENERRVADHVCRNCVREYHKPEGGWGK